MNIFSCRFEPFLERLVEKDVAKFPKEAVNVEPHLVANFFSTTGNTVQMVHTIACHVMFCEGYNTNTGNTLIVAPLSVVKEREIFKQTRGPYNFEFCGLKLAPCLALLFPVGVDVTGQMKSITESVTILYN